MRIVTSAFLAALLVIQTACSPAADPESSPAEERAPEETEAAEADDEPSDSGDGESTADGESEELDGLDDLEDLVSGATWNEDGRGSLRHRG